MTTIYLLRHCALPADYRERYVGQIDPPLSADGVRQAGAMAHALRGRGIDTVYCSDLVRSRQTAEIIAQAVGAPLEVRKDLREIALGEWEGLLRREVAAVFPAQYAARGNDIEHYRIPGGESLADCQQRMLDAWQDIARDDGRCRAIVSHAGANRALLSHLSQQPLSAMFGIGQDYGCVNVIQLTAAGALVQRINDRCEALAASL